MCLILMWNYRSCQSPTGQPLFASMVLMGYRIILRTQGTLSPLLEFRGDTWISDPNDNNNRSTLYDKPNGVVLNTYNGSAYQSFNINTTFTVDISGGGDVPLLTWVTSGANNSTSYSWLQHQVWASWFDLDYRPGASLDTNTSVWKSHNRANGACHVLSNTSNMTWQECRTVGGDSGAQGNPPLMLHAADANSWYNQRRIGKE